jgi:fatty-acyl-CoA synthase
MLPTVPQTLARTANKHPEWEAIVYPETGTRLTYRELDGMATRFANALRERGVEKGDVVSVALHNSVPMIVAIFGITRAGGVFSPVNYRLAPSEAAYVLDDSAATVVLFDENTRGMIEGARDDLPDVEEYVYVNDDTDEAPEYAAGFHELLEGADETPPGVENAWDDLWAIMYTSGTTGRPKGVLHTHGDASYHNLPMMGGMEYDDVSLIMMPLYHNAALNCALLPSINLGATSVVLSGFDPDQALEVVDEEGVTSMSLPSRTWRQVLQARESGTFDGSSLTSIGYGTSDMPRPLLEDLIETFGEVVSTAYGMTEMGPVATSIRDQDVVEKLGSVGRALPNHEVRIVEPTSQEDPGDPVTPEDTVPTGEEGEIILAGPSMMSGYLNKPEKTDDAIRDGWFFTGDIGRLDEDGFLYLVDRVDDMIISGGENIYPTEVEEVLYDHELVEDVGVVGTDDDQWGEAVTAYVLTAPDTDPGELEEELDRFCRERDDLADFKRPRRYVFVDELPRNPSGKIQRYKLRDRAED